MRDLGEISIFFHCIGMIYSDILQQKGYISPWTKAVHAAGITEIACLNFSHTLLQTKLDFWTELAFI